MINLNKNIFVFFVFFLVLAGSGCNSNDIQASPIEHERSSGKIKIGFSMSTLQEERWQRDRDIFVARAKELGAEVIIQNANNDSDEQLNQVRFLIEQGMDILVIVPQDCEKAASMVQTARKYGIKVISYDRLIRNADVDIYISFDNVKVGRLMAESLAKKVPRGNYVIINGARTDYNSYMFNEGYKSVLKKFTDKGEIKVVNEIWTNDWKHEDAFQCIEDSLRNKLRIDAVIAANDSLAAAAIEALSENRMAGRVPVVGHDADLAGCQRVVEGTQLMTVYKPIHRIAKTAAEISVWMAKGEEVKANSVINDGKYNVPYYMIQPIAVTKNNMKDTIIADSFHGLEDIYINVPKSQWPAN